MRRTKQVGGRSGGLTAIRSRGRCLLESVFLGSAILAGCSDFPDGPPPPPEATADASTGSPADLVLPNNPPESLPLKIRPQEGPWWCWAAVTEMMLEHLTGGDYSQTDLMHEASQASCPPVPCTSYVGDCNQAGWPPLGAKPPALDWEVFGKKFAVKQVPGALRWEDLRTEMEEGRPVAFAWCWRSYGTACSDSGGGEPGHMMIAAGVTEELTSGPIRAVLTINPAPCCQGDLGYLVYKAYAGWIGYENSYRHWRSYYCLQDGDGGDDCPEYQPATEEGEAGSPPEFVGSSAEKVAREVLARILPDLQSLITLRLRSEADLEAELGAPLDLAAKLVLGPELRRFVLPPHRLLDPDFTGDNADSLLEDTGLSTFPLLVDGRTVSSILTARIEPGTSWELAGFGQSVLPSRLAEARALYAQAVSTAAAAKLVEVEVPGLNARFLAPLEPGLLTVSQDVGSCLPSADGATQSWQPFLAELQNRARALRDAGYGPS